MSEDKPLVFRLATADDAEILADIVDETSEGILKALLEDLFPGVARQSLLALALREEASHYSHNNTVLVEFEGDVVGLLFAYHSRYQNVPDLIHHFVPGPRFASVEDILTAHVPDTLYINTFWVASRMRGTGLADSLMDYAKMWAEQEDAVGISLHVWVDNKRALSFYKRHGFAVMHTLPPCPALAVEHPEGSNIMGWNPRDEV